MLLQVNNLTTSFKTARGWSAAVNGVHCQIEKGKLLCLVGESGCGKSVTAMSVMGLLPKGTATVSGTVLFEGVDLFQLTPEKWREFRGKKMGMIFQEPMTSLNPVMTVGKQVGEAISAHFPEKTREAIHHRVIELFKKVGISEAEERYESYPHELSGGMRQRVMIAMALCCAPQLLIADEPTTALDVTIQAQILELIRALQKENTMAVMLITHDLGVVREVADEVIVMYAGKMIEQASASTLFQGALHPYTKALMACVPRLEKKQGKLNAIAGMVPSLGNFPSGCAFRDRCPIAKPHCQKKEPDFVEKSPGHKVSCFEV